MAPFPDPASDILLTPGRRRSPDESATTAARKRRASAVALRTQAATPAPPARIPARARRQVSRCSS
jgi:hypothetical protein